MIKYRELVKKTSKIIASSQFKQFLFKLYKINKDINCAQVLAKDWLRLLQDVVAQQKKNREQRHVQQIKHYNQNCVMGYYGFVYDPSQLEDNQCWEDLVKLFMRVQLYYLLEKIPRQNKKHRLPIYPTLNGYHQSVFLRELALNQKSLDLQSYNQTIRFE